MLQFYRCSYKFSGRVPFLFVHTHADDFRKVLVHDQYPSHRNGLFHLYRSGALRGQKETRLALLRWAHSPYWKQALMEDALPGARLWNKPQDFVFFSWSSTDIPFRGETRSQYMLRSKTSDTRAFMVASSDMLFALKVQGRKEAEPVCKVKWGKKGFRLIRNGGSFWKQKGEPALEEETWTELEPGKWYWGLQEADHRTEENQQMLKFVWVRRLHPESQIAGGWQGEALQYALPWAIYELLSQAGE